MKPFLILLMFIICCKSFITKSSVFRSTYKFNGADLRNNVEFEKISHTHTKQWKLHNNAYNSLKLFDKKIQNASKRNIFNTIGRCLLFFSWCTRRVFASGGMPPSGNAVHSTMSPLQGVSLWGTLFVISAALHSAESAMTKLSPWKVYT